MEKVKETKDYTIFKKRSERYAVKGADGKWINGDEKAKILITERLVKADRPKPKEEPEAAPETTEASSDAAGEDAEAEEKPEDAEEAKEE